ncbi:MAG TPA: hypothetical protein VND80_03240 [Steroidobacteraceae bacterium]|nr:hypothetical protein [Steroidobacteraceae bacterium]
MTPSPPRTLRGPYDTEALPGAVSCLRARATPAWSLYLCGAGDVDLARGSPAAAGALTVAWTADGATIAMEGADRTVSFAVAVALLHEPLGALYADLPLAHFEAPARRFWARVMLLVRLPGGAWLIGRLARAGRRGVASD